MDRTTLPAIDDRPGARGMRVGLWRRVTLHFETVIQLFGAIRRGPFWWLLPFCIVLTVFAVLLILLQVLPGAAPFVYAMF
jgi:hypothetical protein